MMGRQVVSPRIMTKDIVSMAVIVLCCFCLKYWAIRENDVGTYCNVNANESHLSEYQKP